MVVKLWIKMVAQHGAKNGGKNLGKNGVKTEYMVKTNVVSKYNCHMFYSLPHTLRRQSPWGESGGGGACAVATRGEAAQVLGSRQ